MIKKSIFHKLSSTIKKLLIILSVSSIFQHVYAMTTLDITQATLGAIIKVNGSCLNYKIPTRFCMWVNPLGERTVTPLLDHYLPDLVVVVYRNGDENPWVEARILLDNASNKLQTAALPDAGGGESGFLESNDQQIIFKEADVIGNPALVALPQKLVLLPSTATPMRPYFQSMLDSTLWRGLMPEALPEEAASVALAQMHHIGTGLNDWGGVYPHEGSVLGLDDAKASMVIAERATDLLTNEHTFGHVYAALKNQCGAHCHAAPITENSKETLFQMISPIVGDECTVFGTDASYNDATFNKKGAYAWIVWRHYQGCADGEGKFVGVMP